MRARLAAFGPLVAVALVAFGGALAIASTTAGNDLEDTLYDARLRVRGDPEPSGRVALVLLDDASLRELGLQAPIPRDRTARIVRRLQRAGAAAQALDFGYIEPADPESEFIADEDLRLVDALRQARPAVVADIGRFEDGTLRPFLWFGRDVLAETGIEVGNTAYGPPGGGTYRRVPYALDGLLTFPVAAARAGGLPVDRADFSGDGALIDFPRAIPTYSFADVDRGRVPAREIDGRVVVLGDVTTSNQDRHPVPTTDELVYGVEINAAAVDTIARGIPLREAPGWVGILLVGLCAAAPAAAAGWRGAAWAPVAVAVAGVAALLVATQLLLEGGAVVGLVAPLLALGIATLGSLAVMYVRGWAERRRMRRAVERFLPQAAVQRALNVAAAGEGRSAGGMRRTLGRSDTVAGYRIDGVLGRGGMGVVYEATQESLDRKVALKLLAEDLGDEPDLQARFRREALLQSSIDHPHVVRVFDAGEDEAGLYIAMQLIRGTTLGRLISDRELDDQRALDILDPVAEALDAAHREGLVHRDVKPPNILVGAGGEPYLSDFGLIGVAEETGLTRTGQFVGTVDYAAPEQIQGEPVSAATDVYALAAVYHCALTGRPPFAAASFPATLFGHLKDPPPKVTASRPDLPPEVDAVIARGLAKRPQDRHATAGELARDVRAALGLAPPARSAGHRGAPAQPARDPASAGGTGTGRGSDGATVVAPEGVAGRGSDGGTIPG